MQKLKIIFFGTPEFAVPVLETLTTAHEVVAVVTAPDKPAGRGMQLQFSAVKNAALRLNLPVLQPEKLKNEDFVNELKAFGADLFVVVAFRMLPEIVWNMPPLGSINLHASLLPQYRGAAPINWAIINGEKETGLTTFKLQHEIDTGNIIFQEKIAIAPDMNVGELYQTMMGVGKELMLKTVNALAENKVVFLPQNNFDTLQHAPKLFKETGKINWQQNVAAIHNLVRGLSPYPAAHTFYNGKNLKIFQTKVEMANPQEPVGVIVSDNKTFLKVATVDGYLLLLELQLEGKKRMPIEEFLRGNSVENVVLG